MSRLPLVGGSALHGVSGSEELEDWGYGFRSYRVLSFFFFFFTKVVWFHYYNKTLNHCQNGDV